MQKKIGNGGEKIFHRTYSPFAHTPLLHIFWLRIPKLSVISSLYSPFIPLFSSNHVHFCKYRETFHIDTIFAHNVKLKKWWKRESPNWFSNKSFFLEHYNFSQDFLRQLSQVTCKTYKSGKALSLCENFLYYPHTIAFLWIFLTLHWIFLQKYLRISFRENFAEVSPFFDVKIFIIFNIMQRSF